MKTIRITSLIFVCCIFLASCGKSNRFGINTSKNRVEVKVKRFDIDVIRMDTINPTAFVDTLLVRYPKFFPYFIENIMDTSITNNQQAGKALRDFVASPLVSDINRRVVDLFSDITDVENEFSDAYTYLVHYFPEMNLPEMIFYVSGMNIPMLSDNNHKFVAAGTDFYLGSSYEPYTSVVYDYMLQDMEPDRLPVDMLSAVLFGNFNFDGKSNRLIDNMLYNGKVLYLLSVIMPERTGKDIVGYTTEQWLWAEKHESDIWKAIVGQKDLFSSDLHLIRKYMNEAPFTAPVSQESPGMLGGWIGFRIVESYMDRNRDVTLQQLMQMNEYQHILEKSGYKP